MRNLLVPIAAILPLFIRPLHKKRSASFIHGDVEIKREVAKFLAGRQEESTIATIRQSEIAATQAQLQQLQIAKTPTAQEWIQLSDDDDEEVRADDPEVRTTRKLVVRLKRVQDSLEEEEEEEAGPSKRRRRHSAVIASDTSESDSESRLNGTVEALYVCPMELDGGATESGNHQDTDSE